MIMNQMPHGPGTDELKGFLLKKDLILIQAVSFHLGIKNNAGFVFIYNLFGRIHNLFSFRDFII